MVELRSIEKRYDDFNLQFDLSVKRGELVSLLGPSGSGKTTSLRLIAGFEQPDSGRVMIAGKDVTGLGPAERRIGYVFQDFTLFPHMTVAGNIGYGLRVRKESRKLIEERVERMLMTVNLPGYGNRSVEKLSGGERQRVAIARALAVEPVVLLLDEPFSSIDEVLRRELRQEVLRLKNDLGITIIFVTHSRGEALSISDRVAVLESGRLRQVDTPEEVYHRPKKRFVASFVGDVSRLTNENGQLLIRPEQATLVSRDGPVPKDEEQREIISGDVLTSEFLGHAYLHTVTTKRGTVLVYGADRLRAGDGVYVNVPTTSIVKEERKK